MDERMKITDVLSRAGVPKDQYEKRMNQARKLLADAIVWPDGHDCRERPYAWCVKYSLAGIVYIKKEDEQRFFEAFTNEDILLNATN
jgi:hypothetical protein